MTTILTNACVYSGPDSLAHCSALILVDPADSICDIRSQLSDSTGITTKGSPQKKEDPWGQAIGLALFVQAKHQEMFHPTICGPPKQTGWSPILLEEKLIRLVCYSGPEPVLKHVEVWMAGDSSIEKVGSDDAICWNGTWYVNTRQIYILFQIMVHVFGIEIHLLISP